MLINGLQGRGEALRISFDQGTAELRLPRKVVVQAGLRDVQLRSDVGITEPVEATQLYQPLRDIQDARGRIRAVNCWSLSGSRVRFSAIATFSQIGY